MYSGSDSNESQKYAQWALNPASFQNVPGEQVDWAALAQQWIIMKEAGPPPMPGDQPIVRKGKRSSPEGGEAEMDVENDKEAPPPPVWSTNEAPPPPSMEPWNWSAQNASWNWSNNWAPPVPPPAPSISGLKAPLLPTPNNSYVEPIESTSDNATPFGSHANANSPHYWNNTSASPTKHIKPHNKRYSKVNVPIRAPAPIAPSAIPVDTPPVSGTTLDTAKRKQLPAWIREGLEKMEKDKLKQMEKQKEKEERESYLENSKPNKETIEILKTTMKERQRSRFESDGENSEEDTNVKKRQKSTEPAPLSHDELMLKVRHTMTEILLSVTNRHIESVCREELQRFMKNQKASQAASAPSGATIRSRLGLGIYGDDDSGSSSGDDTDEDFRRNSRNSDEELKDTIKRKMADFQKTEREIENRLEDAERCKGGSLSRSQSPESNDNESQVDARDQDRKYEQDTRQTASSPKSYDKQKTRSQSCSSHDSDYSNNRSKTSRRSSSEESKNSYKRSKKRSSSPKKRHRSTSSHWSKSPSRRDSSSSRRDSRRSKKTSSSKRSRSRSYSRSRRSRSSSYKRSKRTLSRERSRRSKSSSRSRYSRRSPSSSRSDRRRRRRSRSESSSRGKRSHRH